MLQTMTHRRRRERRAAAPPNRAALVALATYSASQPHFATAAPREDERELRADDPASLRRLATVFDSDRSTSGAMFDVKAKQSLVLQGMDIDAVKTANDKWIEIWTRAGSFKGHENDESAWTLWLNATVSGMGIDEPTTIPRDLFSSSVTVMEGEKQAFYVSFPEGRYLRLSSEVQKNFFRNQDIVVYGKGAAKKGRVFGGTTISPRLFNGALYYETLDQQNEPPLALPEEEEAPIKEETNPSLPIPTGESPVVDPAPLPLPSEESLIAAPIESPQTSAKSFTTEFDSSATYAGIMFDLEAKDNLEIDTFAINIYKKEYITIRLYTRVGTYRGSDKDLSRWKLVTTTSVLGQGVDRPTYLPEGAFKPILVRRGKRQAFYITAEGPWMRSGKGIDEGRQWKGNEDLVIFEGAGKRYPIEEATFASRLFNGIVGYDVVDIPTDAPTQRPTKRPTKRPTRQPTRKPTTAPPDFRLRLYWQRGYFWQESSREMFWCMECRNNCRHGDSIYIDRCDSGSRQRFTSVGDTIRPARDTSLCLTSTGTRSEERPIRALRCDGGSDQKWEGLKFDGRFELHPKGRSDRCVTQQHHPKAGERVYPEDCRKPRDHDTAYWIVT